MAANKKLVEYLNGGCERYDCNTVALSFIFCFVRNYRMTACNVYHAIVPGVFDGVNVNTLSIATVFNCPFSPDTVGRLRYTAPRLACGTITKQRVFACNNSLCYNSLSSTVASIFNTVAAAAVSGA